MPKKSDAAYIQDMLTYARRVSERIRGISRDDFEATVTHQESVAYNLMIVGEAASKLTEETRTKHPAIPVERNQGHANGQAETERETLWETATIDIPILIAALETAREA